MSEWQPIETAPARDMAVLVFYGNREFHDCHGNVVVLSEMRAAVEKTEVAWFQDGCWYQSGTGHDLFESWCIEGGNIPTRWMPLSAPPEIHRIVGSEQP